MPSVCLPEKLMLKAVARIQYQCCLLQNIPSIFYTIQFVFFDFCTWESHKIVAREWMEAVKVAPLIPLSPKRGTDYSFFCGKVRVRAELVKIALK